MLYSANDASYGEHVRFLAVNEPGDRLFGLVQISNGQRFLYRFDLNSNGTFTNPFGTSPTLGLPNVKISSPPPSTSSLARFAVTSPDDFLFYRSGNTITRFDMSQNTGSRISSSFQIVENLGPAEFDTLGPFSDVPATGGFGRAAVVTPDGESLVIHIPADGVASSSHRIRGYDLRAPLAPPTQDGFVKASRISITEPGILESVSLYSNVAEGNVRVALYSEGATKGLIWQSDVVANSAQNGFLTIPVSQGSPESVRIYAPGDYWLAWQVDTDSPVPALVEGVEGDGFSLVRSFGDFPATITSGQAQSTNETWTSFATLSDIGVFAGNPIPGSDEYPTSSLQGRMVASEFEVNETGVLDLVSIYSQTASGNLRAAIYRDDVTESAAVELLWQSGSVGNNTTNGFVEILGESGTPSLVVLEPGSYWLALQTDSSDKVLTFLDGEFGSGFEFEMPFGSFPAVLDNPTVSSAVWTVGIILGESLPPTTVVIAGAPELTNSTTIEGVTVEFNNIVTGLEPASFETDGINVVSVNGTERNYTLDLELTGADGAKTIRLPEDAVQDLSGEGNEASNVISIQLDTTPPSITLAVTPSLQEFYNSAPISVVATTSEPVVGFSASSINVVNATLGAFEALPDGLTYTWELSPISDGEFSSFVPAGAVQDPAGNSSLASNSIQAVFDQTPPTATLAGIDPAIRNQPIETVEINFSEPVLGVGISAFTLEVDSTPIPLEASMLEGTDASYTLDISSLNDSEGDYVLTLSGAGSGVTDRAGNTFTQQVVGSWTLDVTPPVASIENVLPDPRSDLVESLAVTFSEQVDGVSLGAFSLTLDNEPVTLSGANVTGAGANYTISNLQALTVAEGSYELRLVANGSGIADLAGNEIRTDAFTSWLRQSDGPDAVIGEVVPDIRNIPVETVEVTFSRPVTDVSPEAFILTRDGFPVSLGDAVVTSVPSAQKLVIC